MANILGSSMAREPGEAAAPTASLAQVFASRKMAAILVLGFASGLPLYLTSKTLQAWMTLEKVDIKTISAFSLVALPYSFKWIWSPLIDRYSPGFLGRRRGWLVVTQVLLLLAIAAMSLHDPRTGLRMVAINAVVIAFLSATQDIAFDAYKIDVLSEPERGAGAAIGVLGYRVALLVTGSLAFILADRMPWPTVYVLMGLLMLVGLGATLFAPDPAAAQRVRAPVSLKEAIVDPFADFLHRTGAARFVPILLFIVLYKLGDAVLNNLATPFLLKAGFSQTEIGAVQGGMGLLATIAGVLVGGALQARIGLVRSLWIFGVLQSAVNVSYYVLSLNPSNRPLMFAAVVLENFFQGTGTAALVAYLMSLSNPRFSATQYALLSSFMAFGRDGLAAYAGAIQERVGWPEFFLISIALAVPGILLLPLVAPWRAAHPIGAAPVPGEVGWDASVGGRGETADQAPDHRA